jgi:hypothetical protein
VVAELALKPGMVFEVRVETCWRLAAACTSTCGQKKEFASPSSARASSTRAAAISKSPLPASASSSTLSRSASA